MPHVTRKQIENHASGPGSTQDQVQPVTSAPTSLILQRAYADPGSLTPKDVLHLQRTIGNRATIGMLARHTGIQAKLKLGPAGDQYEQEADRVAQQVVRQMARPQPVQRQNLEEDELQMKPLSEQGSNALQRQYAPRPKMVLTKPGEGTIRQPKPPAATISRVQRAPTPHFTKSLFVRRQEEEDELQMKPLHGPEGGEVEQSVEQQIQSARGGGKPLDGKVRGSMEKGFGADFSGVRVHTGGQADALNRSLNAKAFTVGNDVFFGRGQYNPGSSAGKTLLAHELTHTVQQGAAGAQREMIQPKLTGAAAALRQQGGGLTGEVVAKKVFSIGIYKSTYEKILNAVAAYEKEEAKGKKSTTWFLSKLTAIEKLCNNWLGSKGHKDELDSARASAIETLLDKVDQEKKSLGGSSSSLLLIDEEDESSGEGTTTSSGAVSLANPPWDQTQSCVAKGSGHGGVVIFDFGNGKLVVKNGLENEIYGARLAREMGLSSPETRKLSSDEVSIVTQKMKEFGVKLPSGTPNLVLEYLPGITMGDVRDRKAKLTKPEVYGVAASVGKWLVFDTIINEIDRFSAVRGGSDKKGINSGNFMLDPNNLAGGLTGIDQSAMTASKQSVEALESILNKEFFFFLSVANGVLEQLGVGGFSSHFDPEDVADVIQKSATEMVKSIGSDFNPDRIFELADDLEVKEETLSGIAKHVRTIQG